MIAKIEIRHTDLKMVEKVYKQFKEANIEIDMFAYIGNCTADIPLLHGLTQRGFDCYIEKTPQSYSGFILHIVASDKGIGKLEFAE